MFSICLITILIYVLCCTSAAAEQQQARNLLSNEDCAVFGFLGGICKKSIAASEERKKKDEEYLRKARLDEEERKRKIEEAKRLNLTSPSAITNTGIYFNVGQCDGYFFEEKCIYQDPRSYNYNGESIWCTYVKNLTPADKAEFLCVRCPKGLVGQGLDCRQCPLGTYAVYFAQYDQVGRFSKSLIINGVDQKNKDVLWSSKANCVDISEYPLKVQGVLSNDKKSLLSRCQMSEIVIKNVASIIKDEIFQYQFCQKCPPGKFVNKFRTMCVETCQINEAGDTRINSNTFGECVVVLGENQLRSRDGLTLVDQCGFREIALNGQQCLLCPYNFPFVSSDRLSCLKQCPTGQVFDQLSGICILLENCSGFVGDHDSRSSCIQNCQSVQKFRKLGDGKVAYGLFVDSARSIPGAKYKVCSFCPPSTPFVDSNSLKCMGCQAGLIADFVSGKCVDAKATPESGRVYSSDKLQIYPECPVGQYMINNAFMNRPVCSVCQSMTYSIPGATLCCKQGQEIFEDTGNSVFRCITQNACTGYLSGNICRKNGCSSADEYASSDGLNYKMCKSCTNFLEPFAGNDSPKCSSKCYSSSQMLIENALEGSRCGQQSECQQYIINGDKSRCLEMPKGCKVFAQKDWYYKSEWFVQVMIQYDIVAASSVAVKIDKYLDCQPCPADKAFVEETAPGIRKCTACLENGKIRDYSTGFCVNSIDNISNAGAGLFMFSRKEFWPMRPAGGASVTWFKSGQNLFAESSCLQQVINVNNDSQKYECVEKCPPEKIVDDNFNLCVIPEKCSAVLSLDRLRCKLEKNVPCNVGEIVVQLNNMLKVCQACPDEFPMNINNICSKPSCPAGSYIQLNKKYCLSSPICLFGFLSIDRKQCIDRCETGYLSNENKECISPEKCFAPLAIDFDLGICSSTCKPNYSATNMPLDQKPGQQALVCQKCPIDKPYSDNVNNQTVCVSQCKMFDQVGNKCLKQKLECSRDYMQLGDEQSFVLMPLGNEQYLCTNQCWPGYGKSFDFGTLTQRVGDQEISGGNYLFWECFDCRQGLLRNEYSLTGKDQYDSNPPFYSGYKINEKDTCVSSCQTNEYADRISRKCFNLEQCISTGRIGDQTNWECVNECPAGYANLARGTVNGKPKIITCSKTDSATSCTKDQSYKQALVLGKLFCYKSVVSDMAGLIDRVNEANGSAELFDWNQCLGVVSLDETECLIQCKQPFEVIKWITSGQGGTTGYFKCQLCIRHLDQATRTLSDCLENCREGYLPNKNNICISQQKANANSLNVTQSSDPIAKAGNNKLEEQRGENNQLSEQKTSNIEHDDGDRNEISSSTLIAICISSSFAVTILCLAVFVIWIGKKIGWKWDKLSNQHKKSSSESYYPQRVESKQVINEVEEDNKI